MNICDKLETSLGVRFNNRLQGLVSEHIRIQNFGVNTIILNEGQNSNNIYLILHGIVRGFYLDQNGNDVTKCFAIENEFFCTESFRTGKPSTFFIECLENCTCVEIPNFLIRQVMKQDGKLSISIGRLFEYEVNKLEYRNRNILMLSAEERYLSFCENYPQLKSRIPLKYIASYIAVRPETLSRIRKKLKLV
jgi:CRP-like cAMP-binding protein